MTLPPLPEPGVLSEPHYDADQMRAYAEQAVAAERERMRATISDDMYAATFQTLGQYRSSLLRAFWT